jgi:hypothetical protein
MGTLNRVDFSRSIRNLSGGKSPSLYILSPRSSPIIGFALDSSPLTPIVIPFLQFRYGYSKMGGLTISFIFEGVLVSRFY